PLHDALPIWMIKHLKTGTAAILMTVVMSAPAWGADQPRVESSEPVRTAAVSTQAIDLVPRNTPSEDRLQQPQPESNGWAMLAAGLAVGLLIITRRQRGRARAGDDGRRRSLPRRPARRPGRRGRAAARRAAACPWAGRPRRTPPGR